MSHRTLAVLMACWLALGAWSVSPALAATLPPARRPAAAPTHALDAALERAHAHPDSADAQFEWAMTCAHAGALAPAWEALQRVYEIDPDYADRVVERYGAQVLANPGSAEAHFRLAAGFGMRGEREAARIQLEHVVALAPKDARAWTYLGYFQAEGGHVDLAMASWNRSLAIDPDDAATRFLAAQGMYRQGHFLQAIAAQEQAMKARGGEAFRP